VTLTDSEASQYAHRIGLTRPKSKASSTAWAVYGWKLRRMEEYGASNRQINEILFVSVSTIDRDMETARENYRQAENVKNDPVFRGHAGRQVGRLITELAAIEWGRGDELGFRWLTGKQEDLP